MNVAADWYGVPDDATAPECGIPRQSPRFCDCCGEAAKLDRRTALCLECRVLIESAHNPENRKQHS